MVDKNIFSNSPKLPSSEEIQIWDKKNLSNSNTLELPYYVKLHGSFGWFSEEGSYNPIFGGAKVKKIISEPILEFYNSKFEDVLSEQCAIWIIGYSFSDEHINEKIIKSIENNGSSLYVIDIKTLNCLYDDKLNSNPMLRRAFEKGLSGYFSNKLSDIFPKTNNYSYAYKQISNLLED